MANQTRTPRSINVNAGISFARSHLKPLTHLSDIIRMHADNIGFIRMRPGHIAYLAEVVRRGEEGEHGKDGEMQAL
jgi:hypothetical protein